MFGLNTLQMIAAALVAAFLLAGAAGWKGYSMGKAHTDAAVAEALNEARLNTENAINELADEADRARVRRSLCLTGGGVWVFADNKCDEIKAQP